jgi:hypothetical protein
MQPECPTGSQAGSQLFFMSFTDRKSKIVSFRLSEAEYETVEEICRMKGFSSMAFFARSATLAFSSGEELQNPLELELLTIRHRLDALTAAFKTLSGFKVEAE